MKALALASLLALAAPAADAGDVGFRIDFGIQHKGVRVRVGVGKPARGVKHAPAPAPRPKYRHRHRQRRVWVPGHYEIVRTKVWVPAYTHKVRRPAEYGYRRDRCGFRVRYVVRPAHWETIHVAGHWDYRSQKVWRPGYYKVSPRARHRRGHRL
ncbi:MAG: hypothetical protein ACYTG3_05785 [Planctomycetota bacterium]|jgi:hypothetical protein